nr:carboxypeptidase B-like [Lytechinus pictus]
MERCGGRAINGGEGGTHNNHYPCFILRHQVWRIIPATYQHVEWLGELERTRGEEFDFWTPVLKRVNHPVDIMVRPDLQNLLRTLLQHRGLGFHVMIDDVGELVSSQMSELSERRENGRSSGTALSGFDYNVYHTYEEIMQWVDDIATEYSHIVESFLLGYSSEGRPIKGIKIRGTGSHDANPRAVWFEGGIHAREWVSPATVMGFTQKLLDEYDNGDNLVVEMFDNLDWYIIPSLNVDGYSYTWSSDRMWRKTRSLNAESPCIGTDPNRNWPYEWGGVGASAWECSDTYRGARPVSEIEVSNAIDFMRKKKADGQDFIVFIDFHSYSQVIIAPWSYLDSDPRTEDYNDQMALALEMQSAIKDTHGVVFNYGAGAEILYACSGVTSDWGYGTYSQHGGNTDGGLGAKYSYTVELRDEGQHGFLLPEDQIQPSYEEMHAAVRALGAHVLNEMSATVQ